MDIAPDALQWDVEREARGLCDLLLGCIGFRLFYRDERCKVAPMGRMVRTGGAA